MRIFLLLTLSTVVVGSCTQLQTTNQGAFPYAVTEETRNRELSAAMKRSFYLRRGFSGASRIRPGFAATRLAGGGL